MAHATFVTIATGTTTYTGDPDCDQRISAREVRVDVTYQLAPGEDAARVASVKADEVERTRRAAWERIQAGPDDSFDPSGMEPEPPDDADSFPEPDPFLDEADYTIRSGEYPDQANGSMIPSFSSRTPAATGSGQSSGQLRNGVGSPGPASPSLPNGETEWATKPQQIVLKSEFRRLGVSGPDQTALLRARFGKFRLERLTKAEATQLMQALERGEVQREAASPTTAH